MQRAVKEQRFPQAEGKNEKSEKCQNILVRTEKIFINTLTYPHKAATKNKNQRNFY